MCLGTKRRSRPWEPAPRRPTVEGRVTGGGYKRPPRAWPALGCGSPLRMGQLRRWREETAVGDLRMGGRQHEGRTSLLPARRDWQRPASWSSAPFTNICLRLIATKIWWYWKCVSLEVIVSPLDLLLTPSRRRGTKNIGYVHQCK